MRRSRSSANRDSLQPRNSIAMSSSKIPRSTPLVHSTRKVMPSTGKSSKRTSYFSTMDHHLVKDTRSLSEKPVMRRCINDLINTLAEFGYPTPLNVKMMNPPTNKEYFRIFEFTFQLMAPQYKMIVKPEEEAAKILHDLGYPISISKSTLNNIGAMSAWPHALGALDWLMDLAKYYKRSEDTWAETFFPDDDEQPAMCGYLSDAYTAFMHGENPPFVEIDKALDSRIAEMTSGIDDEIESKSKELEEKREKNEALKKENESITQHEQEIKRLESVTGNFEDYFDKLDKYNASLQEKIEGLEVESDKCDAKILELTKRKVEIESIISSQDMNKNDVQDMETEIKHLESKIKSTDARTEQILEQFYEKQVQETKMLDKIDAQIAEYTAACQQLDFSKLAESENWDVNELCLKSGRRYLQDNNTKLLSVIRPKIAKMMSELLKEKGEVQLERNHKSSQLEQMKEELAEKKRTTESIKNDLDKLLAEEEQKSREVEKSEQKMAAELEQIKEDIKRLKTINTLSVEQLNERKDAAQKNYDETVAKAEKEADEVEQAFDKFCQECSDYKDKFRNLLVELDKNSKKVFEENIPEILHLQKEIIERKDRLQHVSTEMQELCNSMQGY